MMRTFILSTLVALAACSPYSPDLGNQPFKCGTEEPICPDGYACMMTAPNDMRCVSIDQGAMPDSNTTGFPCADDSSLEGSSRNDTPANAYQTPVDTQRSDLTLAGLAICPEGDKDNYAVTLSGPNKGLEVVVTWDSGQPISMSLLNAGGASIVNGTANGEKSLRACAANLPMGTYYGSVFATGMTKNNYRLAIKVVPNC